MQNPIRAFEDYFGVRQKGRRLTLKERYQAYSVESLKLQILPTAIKWAACYALAFALLDLVMGRDMHVSDVLFQFVFLFACYAIGLKILHSAGRKNKTAGTY